MKAWTGLSLSLLSVACLGLLDCGRHAQPPPVPKAAPLPAPDPWSWHFAGGLLVIEGEVQQPTEVTLKGRYISTTRHLPFGPVRWEMYRPPPGEVVDLRSADGTLLAHWDFDAPAPRPVAIPKPIPAPLPPPPPPPTVVAAPKPIPAPLPKPPPPPPKVVVAPKPVPVPVPKPPPSPPKVVAAPKPVPVPPPPPPPKVVAAPKPVPAPVPKPPPPPPKVVATPKPTPAPLPPPPPPPPKPIPAPVPPLPPPSASAASGVGLDSASLWPGSGKGVNVLRGPTGAKRICMTFDGGSSCEVAVEVLDLLRQRGIHTTFFVTGDFVKKYPELVRRMDHEGHEVGNHSLTHPHFAPNMKRDPRWTKERFQGELLDTDRIFYQLLGRPMDPLWRAPFGEQTPELRKWAEELGYRHVGWSEGADTLDWATVKERRLYRTGNAILDRLYGRMEKRDGDGLIVLMHLGSGRPEADRPAKVLGPFLDRAARDGWHFVTISEYVKGLGLPAWESGRRIALLGRRHE